MKTLVIHPYDPTTSFLQEVYEGRGFTVSTQEDESMLRKSIEEHDRIILLGHGGSHGLYNRYMREIIDASYVRLLKEKILVGVWCYANDFFEHWKLNGKYTGMIISEMAEAYALEVAATGDQILWSNVKFALALREAIDADDFVGVMHREYDDPENPIIVYNRGNIFNRRNGDVIRLQSVSHKTDGGTHSFAIAHERDIMLSKLYGEDVYIDNMLYHVKSVHLSPSADIQFDTGQFGLIVRVK